MGANPSGLLHRKHQPEYALCELRHLRRSDQDRLNPQARSNSRNPDGIHDLTVVVVEQLRGGFKTDPMKRRANKRPPGVPRKIKPLSIPGWQPFHAGVVILAIDEALKTETDKIARCHLTHSRRYMTEFEQRHPNGVIPRLIDKDEFWSTYTVLRIIQNFGVIPPKDGFTLSN